MAEKRNIDVKVSVDVNDDGAEITIKLGGLKFDEFVDLLGELVSKAENLVGKVVKQKR